ncbi:Derlin-2/3 [Pancytospora epiphaga]|nr:Derlin-2/3 [Pancytospora epiphaga]
MTQNVAVQFLQTTPPITRLLISLIVVTTLLVYLNILEPHQLTYSRFYLKKLQLHRIFTTFIYFGRPSIEITLHVIFLYRYSLMLESSFVKTSDYFYMLLVIFALLFVLSNIYYIPLLGPSLSCTVTYIWTRRNPQTVVQIMGFVSFYAFYLPFIVPMFTLIFEGKVSMEEILGIIVGHIVYYLQDVYPRFGTTILKTPCWCHRLFNERGACCSARRPKGRKLSDFRKTEGAKAEVEEGDSKPVLDRKDEEWQKPLVTTDYTAVEKDSPTNFVAVEKDTPTETMSTKYADFEWDSVDNEETAAVSLDGESRVTDVDASVQEDTKVDTVEHKSDLEDISDFEAIEISEEEGLPEKEDDDDEDIWEEVSVEENWGSNEIN